MPVGRQGTARWRRSPQRPSSWTVVLSASKRELLKPTGAGRSWKRSRSPSRSKRKVLFGHFALATRKVLVDDRVPVEQAQVIAQRRRVGDVATLVLDEAVDAEAEVAAHAGDRPLVAEPDVRPPEPQVDQPEHRHHTGEQYPWVGRPDVTPATGGVPGLCCRRCTRRRNRRLQSRRSRAARQAGRGAMRRRQDRGLTPNRWARPPESSVAARCAQNLASGTGRASPRRATPQRHRWAHSAFRPRA